MKGYLYKDFLRLFSSARMLVLFVAIFAVFGAVGGRETSVFPLYLSLIVGTLPMSFLSYDEAEKFGAYARTLPAKDGVYVAAKYLAGLVISLAAIALNAVIGGIFAFVTGAFSAEALLLNAITMLTAALLAPTLMLPVLFRYGVSKGRIVYYVLIGVSAALMTLSGGRTAEPLPALSVGRALLALGMTACFYVLSIALSVKLYGRYERK